MKIIRSRVRILFIIGCLLFATLGTPAIVQMVAPSSRQPGERKTVVESMFLVFAIYGLFGGGALILGTSVLWLISQFQRESDRCVHCGYSRLGWKTDRCPECGRLSPLDQDAASTLRCPTCGAEVPPTWIDTACSAGPDGSAKPIGPLVHSGQGGPAEAVRPRSSGTAPSQHGPA